MSRIDPFISSYISDQISDYTDAISPASDLLEWFETRQIGSIHAHVPALPAPSAPFRRCMRYEQFARLPLSVASHLPEQGIID